MNIQNEPLSWSFVEENLFSKNSIQSFILFCWYLIENYAYVVCTKNFTLHGIILDFLATTTETNCKDRQMQMPIL